MKILPGNAELDEISLANATNNLNSRIRHTKRSAKARNQFTGEDPLVKDEEIPENNLKEVASDSESSSSEKTIRLARTMVNMILNWKESIFTKMKEQMMSNMLYLVEIMMMKWMTLNHPMNLNMLHQRKMIR